MFKHQYILLIILLNVATTLSAQSFSMSSVGSFAGTNAISSAIPFKSINTCIDVQSGVAVLYGKRNNGLFAIQCEVGLKSHALGVKMFPIPTQQTATIKFIHTPPLNEIFTISILTIDGKIVLQKQEKGYDLFQGININVAHLSPGSYVLKIESVNFVDIVKFVKT